MATSTNSPLCLPVSFSLQIRGICWILQGSSGEPDACGPCVYDHVPCLRECLALHVGAQEEQRCGRIKGRKSKECEWMKTLLFYVANTKLGTNPEFFLKRRLRSRLLNAFIRQLLDYYDFWLLYYYIDTFNTILRCVVYLNTSCMHWWDSNTFIYT